MSVSCHFQGCKALLRIVKRRYIKYHAFAFSFYTSTADNPSVVSGINEYHAGRTGSGHCADQLRLDVDN